MSVNRLSTEHQLSVNRASTECQQSVNRASTERQQSVNRASTERQQSFNRASTERQQSVNRASKSVKEFWACILNNLTSMECSWPTMNVSAAFIAINASADIASASYIWVPTECQQFPWWLSTLYSNELHCAVPKLSFMRSVISICSCIQHHKYACNVSQITSFCL